MQSADDLRFRQAEAFGRQLTFRGLRVGLFFLVHLVQGSGENIRRALERYDADTIVIADNNVTGIDRAASTGNRSVDDATKSFMRSGRNDGAAEARKTQLTNFSDVPNGAV